MRKIFYATAAIALLLGGLIAISGLEVGFWLRIIPAIPFAFISESIRKGSRSGLFWDSGHSPPFLNALGLATVYFVPGTVLSWLAMKSARTKRKRTDG